MIQVVLKGDAGQKFYRAQEARKRNRGMHVYDTNSSALSIKNALLCLCRAFSVPVS